MDERADGRQRRGEAQGRVGVVGVITGAHDVREPQTKCVMDVREE